MANIIAGIVQNSEYQVPRKKQRNVNTMDNVKQWSPVGLTTVVETTGVGCDCTTTALDYQNKIYSY